MRKTYIYIYISLSSLFLWIWSTHDGGRGLAETADSQWLGAIRSSAGRFPAAGVDWRRRGGDSLVEVRSKTESRRRRARPSVKEAADSRQATDSTGHGDGARGRSGQIGRSGRATAAGGRRGSGLSGADQRLHEGQQQSDAADRTKADPSGADSRSDGGETGRGLGRPRESTTGRRRRPKREPATVAGASWRRRSQTEDRWEGEP
jgi:hypothetical protein